LLVDYIFMDIRADYKRMFPHIAVILLITGLYFVNRPNFLVIALVTFAFIPVGYALIKEHNKVSVSVFSARKRMFLLLLILFSPFIFNSLTLILGFFANTLRPNIPLYLDSLLGKYLLSYLYAVLSLLLTYIAGSFVLNLTKVNLGVLRRILYSTALGFLFIGTLSIALVHFNLLTKQTVYLVFAFISLYFIISVKAHLALFKSAYSEFFVFIQKHLFFTLYVVMFFSSVISTSFRDVPLEGDSLYLYMDTVRKMIEFGKVPIRVVLYPFLSEGYLSFFGAVLGMNFVYISIAFFGLLAFLSVFALSRVYLSEKKSLFPSLIYLSSPIVFLLSADSKVDLYSVFLCVLAVDALVLFFSKPRVSIALLLGLFCGAAISVKLTAFFVVLPITLVLLFRSVARFKLSLLAFSLGVLIPLSICFYPAHFFGLKSPVHKEVPLKQFLSPVTVRKMCFAEVVKDDFSRYTLGGPLVSFVTQPANFLIGLRELNRMEFSRNTPSVFYCVFPALILSSVVVCLRKASRKVRLLGFIAILGTFFWYLVSREILWYRAVSMPLLTIFMFYCYDKSTLARNKIFSKFLFSYMVFFLTFYLVAFAFVYSATVYTVPGETKGVLPYSKFVNDKLLNGKKILDYTPRPFPFFVNDYGKSYILGDKTFFFAQDMPSAYFYNILQDYEITYISVWKQYVSEEDIFKESSYVCLRKDRENVKKFFSEHGKLVYEDDFYAIYKISY
ncbi:MAG: glycosyltransferase family 39 protein, partial [Patescibacteria group bacterium]